MKILFLFLTLAVPSWSTVSKITATKTVNITKLEIELKNATGIDFVGVSSTSVHAGGIYTDPPQVTITIDQDITACDQTCLDLSSSTLHSHTP